MKVITKQDYRKRRHLRLRKKVVGTAERPRMSVYVSNRYMYVQFVDDTAGKTLAAVSTQQKNSAFRQNVNKECAEKLGVLAAQEAKSRGIEKVVFDRGGLVYGLRLRSFADKARETGLVF